MREEFVRRYIPLLAFLGIALTGVAAAAVTLRLDQRAREGAFIALADQAVSRVTEQANRHMLLVTATVAHFESTDNWISRKDFDTYVKALDLRAEAPGSVGMGYTVFANRGEVTTLARAYMLNTGARLDVWPETTADHLAVSVLFEAAAPEPRTPPTGFDSYSDPTRRAAMDLAIARGAPQATAPLLLVRDAQAPSPGFVIYAPVYSPTFGIQARGGAERVPTGFVTAAYRGGDFLSAAFDVAPALPIHVTAIDEKNPSPALSEIGDPADPRRGDAFTAERTITVAGRDWHLIARPTAGFQPKSAMPLALALGAVSLLLAAAVAAMLREQNRVQDAAAALAATTERNLAERELMLQEMKHRIKNAIARILAMARQTANQADSVESFTQSFTQRLQAMSNAQDVLTRSKWQRADLGELLRQELAQVFGAEFDVAQLSGPSVELDERTTQALGLTFHELATNTLKYAGGAPRVDVHWTRIPRDGAPWLRLVWTETSGKRIEHPAATGFGTRLIDANVRYDLGGEIERDYRPEGLRITLTVPLPDAPPDPSIRAQA